MIYEILFKYPDYIHEWDRKVGMCSCGSEIQLKLDTNLQDFQSVAQLICCNSRREYSFVGCSLSGLNKQHEVLEALNNLLDKYDNQIRNKCKDEQNQT